MKVSAIVNCRGEGLLLGRALDSALHAIEKSGFAKECELIAVADRPSEATVSVLTHYADRLQRIIEVEVVDLGLARNAGVAAAQGELILFLDGDDLWSGNWVGAAWSTHCASSRAVILHPEYAVCFGARLELLVHSDWRDSDFDARGLAVRNRWISLCGVRREILLEYPIPPADLERRFGFEDWSWYAQLVARGMRHVTVPGTVHFIRLKAVDSMQKSMHSFCFIPSVEFAEYLAADDRFRPYDL